MVWPAWRAALKSDSWDGARDAILSAEIPGPVKGAKRLKQAAISVLVEKFLRQAENMFEGKEDAVGTQRCYTARILQDCRERGIEEVAHFDYLLKLCL